jgi:plastocyanin
VPHRPLLAVGLVALAATLHPAAARATTSSVMIMDYRFQPASLQVPAGATVTWTNHDKAAHDVSGSGLQSPTLAQGQSWSHTFTQPGSYEYLCSLHPDMVASVTVASPPTTSPRPPPPSTVPVPMTVPATGAPAGPGGPAGAPATTPPAATARATTTTSTTVTAAAGASELAAVSGPDEPTTHLPLELVAAIVAAVALASTLLLLTATEQEATDGHPTGTDD